MSIITDQRKFRLICLTDKAFCGALKRPSVIGEFLWRNVVFNALIVRLVPEFSVDCLFYRHGKFEQAIFNKSLTKEIFPFCGRVCLTVPDESLQSQFVSRKARNLLYAGMQIGSECHNNNLQQSFTIMEAQLKNPFAWVEIYVDDMGRAQKFYETVFAIRLSKLPMPDEAGEMEMMSFPWVAGGENASGALVKMENMGPGAGGTLVYFTCDDCAVEEGRAERAGGKVLQPKMPLGEHGFSSIVMDTEGNPIGLHSMK